MQVVKLPVAGQQSVKGTFDYSIALVGDAVIYNVNQGGHPLDRLRTALVPDQGDDEPLPPLGQPGGIDVQDDTMLGVTSQGRPVMAFRSGNRKPGSTEWDNTSSLCLAIGAASNLRPSSQAVVVQVSRKGDKGDPGVVDIEAIVRAVLARIPPPKEANVTEEQIRRIADVTAERVFTLPPADWAQEIQPPEARSGSRFQDMIVVLLANPAVWIAWLQAMGKAARDLLNAKVKF